MTSTILQAAEQGQRLKVMGGLYADRGLCGKIRQYEFPLGMCTEQHGMIPTILLGVTTTLRQVKLISALLNDP